MVVKTVMMSMMRMVFVIVKTATMYGTAGWPRLLCSCSSPCSVKGSNVMYKAVFTVWRLDHNAEVYGLFQVRVSSHDPAQTVGASSPITVLCPRPAALLLDNDQESALQSRDPSVLEMVEKAESLRLQGNTLYTVRCHACAPTCVQAGAVAVVARTVTRRRLLAVARDRRASSTRRRRTTTRYCSSSRW